MSKSVGAPPPPLPPPPPPPLRCFALCRRTRSSVACCRVQCDLRGLSVWNSIPQVESTQVFVSNMAWKLTRYTLAVNRFFTFACGNSASAGSKRRNARGALKQKKRKQQLLIEAAEETASSCCCSRSRSSKIKTSRKGNVEARQKRAPPLGKSKAKPACKCGKANRGPTQRRGDSGRTAGGKTKN